MFKKFILPLILALSFCTYSYALPPSPPPPKAVTQVEAEAGTETKLRSWSPLRVSQAISALATSTVGGLTIDDAEAGDDGLFLYVDWANSKIDYGTTAGLGDMLEAAWDGDSNGFIDADAGGTNADSSAATGIGQVTAGTWSFSNTIAGNVALDDGVGDSPTLTLQDATNATLIFTKVDAGGSTVADSTGSISIKTGDADDYIVLSTTGNVPEIDTAGSAALVISADGGNISLRPDGDDDDYLDISTATNAVTIAVVGEGGLTIDALNTGGASTVAITNSDGSQVANVTVEGQTQTATLNVTSTSTLTGLATSAGGITLDDTSGDSPVVTLQDGDDATLALTKLDAGGSSIVDSDGAIQIQASGDTDDYLTIATAANVPTIATAGSSNLAIVPDGGTTAITGALTVSTTATAAGITSNANLSIKNGATSAGVLSLYEDSDDGSDYITIKAPALAAAFDYVLPNALPGEQSYLRIDTDGTMDYSTGTASIALDAIGDSENDTTIAMTGYYTLLTSTLDSAVAPYVFTISNLDADLSNNTTLMALKFVDNADVNAIFIEAIDDSGGSPNTVFSVGANGKIHLESTIEFEGSTDDGTNVVTLTVADPGAAITATIPAETGTFVMGPAGFGTDNRLVKTNGTGNLTQITGITVDDSQNVSGGASVAVSSFLSTGADPADAGAIRLSNTESLVWEGTQEVSALSVSSEVVQLGDSNADNINLVSAGTIGIKSSGDTSDYLTISTSSNIITITTVAGGDGDLVISAGGGEISFDNENLSTTGTFSAENLASTDDADIFDALTAGNIIIDEAAGTLDFTGASSATITSSGAGAIGFGDDNLSTTGTFQASTITATTALALGDGDNINLGASAPTTDWYMEYNSTQVGLLFSTADVAAAATSTPMFKILVNSGSGTLTDNQDVFAIYNDTTKLMSIDENGNLDYLGSLTYLGSGDQEISMAPIAAWSPSGATLGKLAFEGGAAPFTLNFWDGSSEHIVVHSGSSVTWNGTTHSFAEVTNFVLPTAAADASGEISMSTGNQLKWHDGTKVVTIDTTPTDDNYVLKYDNASATFTLEADETGGTPSWNTVTAPTADVNIIHDAGEETQFTYTGNFTTGNQFNIQQLTGDPSGGVLFNVQAADSNVILARLGDGTNYTQVSQAGNITLAGTAVATMGGIILGDSTPDASGEIGYASNAFTWYANSESLIATASANLWTFSSGTGAAVGFYSDDNVTPVTIYSNYVASGAQIGLLISTSDDGTNTASNWTPIQVNIDSEDTPSTIFSVDGSSNLHFINGGIISQATDNYIKFTENSDTVQFYFDGTDLGVQWSDGALNLENTEDGINAIVNIRGKDAGERGELRVISDGDDKYIQIYNDDTDSIITTSAGGINIIPATGSDILFDGTISIDAGVVTGVTSLTSTDVSLTNDLLLASASIINFDTGDVTITHSAGTLTVGGDGAVTLAIGATDITDGTATWDGGAHTLAGFVDIGLTNDLLLADGAVIGITGNEVITFNAAGSINVTGATMDVDGAFTASTVAADTTVSGTVITASTQIELSHASENTLSASGGVLSVEGTRVAHTLDPVVDTCANFAGNFTGKNLYGGHFIATTTGTSALPAVASLIQFAYSVDTGQTATINRDGSDTMTLSYIVDGTPTQTASLTSLTVTGPELCVFEYRSAGVWQVQCGDNTTGS